MKELKFYEISGLPSGDFDSNKLLDLIGKESFILFYNLVNSISFLGIGKTNCNEIKYKLEQGIPGLDLSEPNGEVFEMQDITAFSVYKHVGEFDNHIFYNLFDACRKRDFLAILFNYTEIKEAMQVKGHLEEILSSKDVRETNISQNSFLGSKPSLTVQRDIYRRSEELPMLSRLLESMNTAILSNGMIYKVFLLTPKNAEHVRKYINNHFLVMNEYEVNQATPQSLIGFLSKRSSIPFGVDYAKEFMRIYGYYSVNHKVPTILPQVENGIKVGKFVKEGVSETDVEIKINPSTLNLGFIITGLPGSGKTKEAMSIINHILELKTSKKPAIFIITPTEEWKGFALQHGMFFIKLCEDDIPINFFRCPPNIAVEKFYSNLAMILSSAANAGPYQNPMEKCMLNAFRTMYQQNRIPDPIMAYDQIERSIIRYHGKKTNSGIKYTKHGENIKSSLEDLRGILNTPQYCTKYGVKIEDFMEAGAIFDLSNASVNGRSHFYALILNQIYALTSKFDTNGDKEIRLIICLEEAHTIFGNIESPAVRDIKQRIQDFRKQGIGLILLTHNVNDIEIGIRRLCQLKLYMKQAPDIAQMASKDLIFGNAEQDVVTLKLKMLPSGIGAFSSIIKEQDKKRQQETIFVKTNNYDIPKSMDLPANPITAYISEQKLRTTKLIKCKLHLSFDKIHDISASSLELYHMSVLYLGEELYTVALNCIESSDINLFEGKQYTFQILDKKEKVLKEFQVTASENIYFDVRKQTTI